MYLFIAKYILTGSFKRNVLKINHSKILNGSIIFVILAVNNFIE
jgi:hypothetical protein